MITQSVTFKSSNANWSCLRIAILLDESIVTVPELCSNSLASIFMKVDFPDPLAPIKPYRLLSEKLIDIFSNRGFEPNCIEILAVEIILNKNYKE